MARLALLVLLLANVGYFAWSHEWLRDFGLGPERQSEPQRIAQQIRPDALVIIGRESEARGDTGDRAEPQSHSQSQSHQSPTQAGSSATTSQAPADNGPAAVTATTTGDCAQQHAQPASGSASESAAARKPSEPCAHSATTSPPPPPQ